MGIIFLLMVCLLPDFPKKIKVSQEQKQYLLYSQTCLQWFENCLIQVKCLLTVYNDKWIVFRLETNYGMVDNLFLWNYIKMEEKIDFIDFFPWEERIINIILFLKEQPFYFILQISGWVKPVFVFPLFLMGLLTNFEDHWFIVQFN